MERKRDRSPPRHTDNDVRKLVKAAFKAGWYVEHPMSHGWGWLVCGGPKAPATGECRIVVRSTPRGNQPRILRERLAKCPHGKAP